MLLPHNLNLPFDGSEHLNIPVLIFNERQAITFFKLKLFHYLHRKEHPEFVTDFGGGKQFFVVVHMFHTIAHPHQNYKYIVAMVLNNGNRITAVNSEVGAMKNNNQCQSRYSQDAHDFLPVAPTNLGIPLAPFQTQPLWGVPT